MKVKIEDLIENPFSENRCSDEKLEQLRQQYQNDGKFLELIEVRFLEDGKYQVVDGHQKLKILR
jgi:ParB-like chromosome segregation protein Spo0J